MTKKSLIKINLFGFLIMAIFIVAQLFFIALEFQKLQKNMVNSGLVAVQIGTHQLTADLAITPEQQQRGLGGVTFLADDQGMLFPYDPPATPGFWMKDMLIPIDIIWISNGRIIAIDANVPTVPQGQKLPVYRSPEPISHVLEVAAGLSERKGFQVGDEVQIFKSKFFNF